MLAPPMHLSAPGCAAIEQREGVKLCVYIDAAGRLTAGMGHLLPPSTSLHNGSPITQDQCDEWARADLQAACDAVNRHVSVPVNQNQFDALVSLVFNIGEPQFTGSTLLRLLNAGNYAGAAAQFVVWDKLTVNGAKVDSPGLLTRRRAEYRQFITPVAQENPPCTSTPSPTPATGGAGTPPTSSPSWLSSLLSGPLALISRLFYRPRL